MGAAALVGLTVAAPLARRAALTQVTNFGSNPTNTEMFIYVPSNVVANPPVIVAIRTFFPTKSVFKTRPRR